MRIVVDSYDGRPAACINHVDQSWLGQATQMTEAPAEMLFSQANSRATYKSVRLCTSLPSAAPEGFLGVVGKRSRPRKAKATADAILGIRGMSGKRCRERVWCSDHPLNLGGHHAVQ